MAFFHGLLVLLVLIVTIWLIKRRKKMSILKDHGIRGPEPNLILGNLREINRKGIHKALQDWEKQYGKVYGFYLGAQATVVIGDAELCKQIEIKDFSNFMNRPILIPGRNQSKLGKHLLLSRDEKWKSMRALMTPSFTSGKLKQMADLVGQSIDVLISKIESVSKSGSEFNIQEYFKALSLDVIAKVAFGVQTNVQNNPNDIFYRGAQDVIQEDTFTGLVALTVCFPEFSFILNKLDTLRSHISLMFGTNLTRAFQKICEDVVIERRTNPENRREDLLQLLVDAEMSQHDIKNSSTHHLTVDYDSDVAPSETNTEAPKPTGRKTVRLADEEVMSNTFMMLFAGYETTSTALAYISHVLVNNPDIQDKIRQEIRALEAEEGGICYTSLSKLRYLDQVWSETLRYYPPIPSFGRTPLNDIRYGELTIPKGISVQMPITTLHRDPEYWTDPDTFDPDRFSKERRSEINPMAYQPFGGGPRNCIGLRFAQMEAKLAIVRLLSHYRLLPGPNTERGDIAVTMKFVIMAPKNGVVVKVEKI